MHSPAHGVHHITTGTATSLPLTQRLVLSHWVDNGKSTARTQSRSDCSLVLLSFSTSTYMVDDLFLRVAARLNGPSLWLFVHARLVQSGGSWLGVTGLWYSFLACALFLERCILKGGWRGRGLHQPFVAILVASLGSIGRERRRTVKLGKWYGYMFKL